jgi:iron-regulated transporter 1
VPVEMEMEMDIEVENERDPRSADGDVMLGSDISTSVIGTSNGCREEEHEEEEETVLLNSRSGSEDELVGDADRERHAGGLSREQAWSLFLSHFLSTWNGRCYEFAAVSGYF